MIFHSLKSVRSLLLANLYSYISSNTETVDKVIVGIARNGSIALLVLLLLQTHTENNQS